jgi:glycosyltransferase involved in cell wall biosynthesis
VPRDVRHRGHHDDRHLRQRAVPHPARRRAPTARRAPGGRVPRVSRKATDATTERPSIADTGATRGRRRRGCDVRALIVIPAYNEEDALPATLKELRALVPDLDVVVVDDGSTDATAAVAKETGAPVVPLPFNLGVGGAVRAGLRWAERGGYDRAVVFDADGQHDPHGIALLLAALDDGADMAVGSRFAPGAEPYRVGRLRAAAMAQLRWLVRVVAKRRFTDVTSGFRAFDRPVLELLARSYPAEYLADTVEALIMVTYAGFRVDEVPIRMRPRAGGRPSSRHFGLVVNYLRLLVAILSAGYRHARRRKDVR